MASLASFGISVILSGTVANPVNSQTFQVVTPWGMSAKRSSLREAMEDVINRTGNEHAGVMGAYFLNQTLNGATTSGAPTPYTTANEVGSP